MTDNLWETIDFNNHAQVCRFLQSQSDKITELKRIIGKQMEELECLSEENEQLKKFKHDCIDWVNAQMRFNNKKYIETEDNHFKNENIDLHNLKVHLGVNENE